LLVKNFNDISQEPLKGRNPYSGADWIGKLSHSAPDELHLMMALSHYFCKKIEDALCGANPHITLSLFIMFLHGEKTAQALLRPAS
jgi:hypothetical protein